VGNPSISRKENGVNTHFKVPKAIFTLSTKSEVGLGLILIKYKKKRNYNYYKIVLICLALLLSVTSVILAIEATFD